MQKVRRGGSPCVCCIYGRGFASVQPGAAPTVRGGVDPNPW